MSQDADEQALAALLYTIYIEALGYRPTETNFKDEPARIQTAWLMVVQYIRASYVKIDEPDHR